MRRTILIPFLLVVIAVVLFVAGPVRTQVHRAQTGDYMGQILVAMDKTLGLPPLGNYSPETVALIMFPDLPNAKGKILDGWGNPIKVVLKRLDGKYEVTLTSAGPDGKKGTADDLVERYFTEDRPGTTNSSQGAVTN